MAGAIRSSNTSARKSRRNGSTKFTGPASRRACEFHTICKNTKACDTGVSLRNVRAILHYEDDDKDQIHDETARQSRSALGIGLINSLDFQVQIRFPRLRQKSGPFA